MSATVIILPVIRREETGAGRAVTVQVELPPRVFARLVRLARDWDIEPRAAAESLLIDAINKAAGVRR